jgi:exonuclease SbcC
MILKTLILKNYRKFKDVTIEFPDGITAIVGLNGVGKSTIFEAIAWVLYGTVAARTSVDQIKRNSANLTESCKVTLDFQYEEEVYRITREIVGKNFTINAMVLKSTRLVASGAVAVNKYIQKIIGMNFKSFYTSIFAKQKELNALSTMNPSERRPLILKMLGINSLDNIIKEINTDKKTKQSIIDKISMDLKDEKGKNKIDIYKKELVKLKDEKNITLDLINKKKEVIRKLKNDIVKIKKEYQKYKIQYENLNSKIDELNENKIIFENKTKLVDDIYILTNKIKNRNKTINLDINKIKKYESLLENIEDITKKMKNLEKSNLKLLNIIQDKKTTSNTIKENILDIIKKKKEINTIGKNATCPTCERLLGEQYNFLINKYNNEISEKNKKIRILNNSIEKEQKNLEIQIKQKNALEKKKEYFFNELRLYDKLKNNIKINQEELKKEQNEINIINNKLTKIKDIKFDYKEYNNFKNKMKKYYSNYQKRLHIFENKKDELNQIQLKNQINKNDVKLLNQIIKNTNEKIKEVKNKKQKIANENKQIANLKMLNQIMVSFRSFLILRIRPILSSYATDLFSYLTNGKYQDVELDDFYNIIIYDRGIPYSIKRYSGGEEDLANLCIRLSISEVITERSGSFFNFIILDEIFGSQDTIHQQNIIKSLKILSSKFKQIFLITHVEEIKNYVENVLHIIESEEGISKIKIN